jgi:hypothetical protein
MAQVKMERFYRAGTEWERRKIDALLQGAKSAENFGIARTVTPRGDDRGCLRIGNAAVSQFEQREFAYASIFQAG